MGATGTQSIHRRGRRLHARRGIVVPKVPAALVVAGLAAYAVALIHGSVILYRSYGVSVDYAFFDQAWFLMAHGHLWPHSSIFSEPYFDDHGQMVMWLLAPLYWLSPNDGLTLMVVEDLSIVAAVGVAAAWVLRLAKQRGLHPAAVAAAAGAVVVVAGLNPWLYQGAYGDLHFEPLAGLFALAVGYDLCFGHRRRAALWAVGALLCGDIGGAYMALVGAGVAVSAKGFRREGAVAAAAGVAWVLILGALHADRGAALNTYAYLVGPGAPALPTAPQVAGGLLAHPGRAIRQINTGGGAALRSLRSVGFAGVLDPLAFLPAVLPLLVNALSSDPALVAPGFQNVVVYLFGALGVGLLAVRLAGPSWRRLLVGMGTAVALTVVAATGDVPVLADHANVHPTEPAVTRQVAVVRAETPPGAEVVSTTGVVGRFAGRRWLYQLFAVDQAVPVRAPEVVFVFVPGTRYEPLPATNLDAAGQWIERRLHGRVLYRGSAVTAYLWRPARTGGAAVIP